jgi:uncharacterized protein
MQKDIEIYILSTGQTLMIPAKDLRDCLSVCRSIDTGILSISLDRVERFLDDLEK